MLVLHGTAEFTEENGPFEKGKRYAFNMFSRDENLKEIIEDVALYLGDLGWNEIDVKKTGKVASDAELTKPLLQQAFNYAQENRFSVITYQDPVDEELKL
ncbi:hypothetical protein [Alteromonas genovensis]|jgi:methyltransferase-like protein|uniref:hypothetical protein n=1 Tax=Alteromonas genovensis TaxID=471225 RepID=UPI002FE1C2BB